MQAAVQVCLHKAEQPFGGECLSVTSEGQVAFRCPQDLLDASFPVTESTFNIEGVMKNPPPQVMVNTHLATAAQEFNSSKRNFVVYSYGQRATPKRQLLFGDSATIPWAASVAGKILSDVVGKGSSGRHDYLMCYTLGATENVVDLLDETNNQGIIAESVKEGPKVRNVEKKRIASLADLAAAFAAITKNYLSYFSDVLRDPTPAEEQSLPAYNPDTIVLGFYRYDSLENVTQNLEANSMHFVALGDSERPALCGIDVKQLDGYEKGHKTLSSVVGVMSAIRCNRLRVPFGKSKLTSLLKRAYNAEKNNPFNTINAPTASCLFVHAFTDDGHAEETYHTLSMSRRVVSVVGTTGIGPATRDLSLEKWRLEQDILELKDELAIAKAVHDYRPCIYDQPKPVANIREEEQKRINAIVKKREEAREKALQEIRVKAEEEARKLIGEQERDAARNIKELERRLEEKRQENAALQSERAKKTKEYEKHLEKIRKRKDDEEQQVSGLKEQIRSLEEELKLRQEAIDKKKKQLELASMDQAKGREVTLQERNVIREQREKLLADRRRQRQQWIEQIRATNDKVLEQVILLAKERKAAAEAAGTDIPENDDDIDETEETVRADIDSINKYLPKLISLEDNPADIDATESIRRQLEEYFTQEMAAYEKRLEEERERKAKLEQAVEIYRNRMSEQQAKQKKEHLAEAVKKREHLSSLVDQVLQYLQHGIRMYKISSTANVRRRFFYLADDLKKIHACELDEAGMPLNRKKPSVTVFIRDIKRVFLGCYTPSFLNYAGEQNLQRARASAMRDDGSYNPDATMAITPHDLGRYNYRSFALQLRGGKTLELVCESDSDCEAWLVALKRILNFKTPMEKEREGSSHSARAAAAEEPAEMGWGGPLDINSRSGIHMLHADEQVFCRDNHIPPMLFLKAKEDLGERSQTSIVTIYDVRVTSTLDLFRSQYLYELLVAKKVIPPMPTSSSSSSSVTAAVKKT